MAALLHDVVDYAENATAATASSAETKAAALQRELGKYRVKDGLDIFVVPRFAQEVLGCADPQELQASLEGTYPVRHASAPITPLQVQWIAGDHQALRYRGNALKRTKIWLQRGDPFALGYTYYYYTGVQWKVVLAQADWARCPEVSALVAPYDAWCERVGAQPASQAIVTAYRNGDHFIGAHFDKPNSIASSDAAAGESLITVVKMGDCGRPFDLYLRDDEQPFWSEVVEPGTAIIMTLEANLQTKHGVPLLSDGATCGNSGSIVWRTISDVRTADEVRSKIAASERAKKRKIAAAGE